MRGTHGTEATPHYKEQLGAEALEFFHEPVEGLGEPYGVVVAHMLEGGIEIGVFAWSAPDRFPIHLDIIGKQIRRHSHEEMLRDIRDSLRNNGAAKDELLHWLIGELDSTLGEEEEE